MAERTVKRDDLIGRFDDIHLDALGMLDEDERAALREWLDMLPASAREQIVREQARLAATAPTAGVREDHVAALREHIVAAILSAAAEGVPIEPAAAGSTSGANARLNGRAKSHDAVTGAPSPKRHASGRSRPRVHPAWRATAIALSVAVVGLFAVQSQLQQSYAAIESEGIVAAVVEAFGPDAEELLFDEDVRRITFSGAENRPQVEASLWVLDDDMHLLLGYKQAITARRLALMPIDATGRISGKALVEFAPEGVLQRVELPRMDDPPRRVALVALGENGTTILLRATVA